MADVKISALTPLATIEDADEFVLVDTSAVETKKVAASTVKSTMRSGVILADGTVPMAADLDLGGNDVINVATVDGRDVSADGAALDAHLVAANPHSIDLQDVVDAQGGTTVTGAPSIEPAAGQSLGSALSPWVTANADKLVVTANGSASQCAIRRSTDIDTGIYFDDATEMMSLVSSGGESSAGATVRLMPGEVRIAIASHNAVLSSLGLSVATTLRPDTDSSRDIGTSAVRWANVYGDVVNVGAGTGVAPSVVVGGASIYSPGSGLAFQDGSSEVARMVAGLVQVTGDVEPEANGTRELGAAATRWASVYADAYRFGATQRLAVSGDELQYTDPDGDVIQLGRAAIATDAGTAITMGDADASKVIRCTAATTVAVSVPSGLKPGTTVEYVQEGAGQVQVAGVGVTLRHGSAFNPYTAEQWSSVVVTILDSDEALVRGDLAVA